MPSPDKIVFGVSWVFYSPKPAPRGGIIQKKRFETLMTIFNLITLFGGLALFLYGMRLMGDGLKKGSSDAFKRAMEKVTNNPLVGFLLGLVVTAVIQSSTATIVLFIGAFRWGVWSAAVATVLSQGTSCVLCLIHLLKKGEVYTVTPRNIRFHTGMLGEIVRYGLPSGIQNCVIGLANVIVQSQINSFGMLAMAAYGAHCKIEGFAFLPITSFTMACTTFVGQNLGAKQYDRAKRGARFCIIIAVVMAELIGLCYYIWASQLISLFDSTPGVVALGVQQARTVALFYCLLAFSHSIAAVCRGAGRAVVPMMIMLSVWCVIRIIYIMLVVHFIGEIGYIYWAYPLTWAISSTIYLIYYLRSDWVHGFER